MVNGGVKARREMSSKQIADEDFKGGSPRIYFSALGTWVLSVNELATQVIAASEEPTGFFVGISSVAKRPRQPSPSLTDRLTVEPPQRSHD